jgi:hypothetical protein
MNKIIYVLGIFIAIIVFNSSCKKESIDNIKWIGPDPNKEYSIPDLDSIMDLSKYNCMDSTIKEAGEYAYVTGYIQPLNVDYLNSRFMLFSEKDNSIDVVFNQTALDIKINKVDSAHIFSVIKSKIKNNYDTSFYSVRIKAEIYVWFMDSQCQKAIGLIGHEVKFK